MVTQAVAKGYLKDRTDVGQIIADYFAGRGSRGMVLKRDIDVLSKFFTLNVFSKVKSTPNPLTKKKIFSSKLTVLDHFS